MFYLVSITTAMQVLDHGGIYLLIAGTYAPYIMIGCRAVSGWGPAILLVAYWIVALFGLVVTIQFNHKKWYPWPRSLAN